MLWLMAGLGGSFLVGLLAIVRGSLDAAWASALYFLTLESWVAITVALAPGRAKYVLLSILLGALLMSLTSVATVMGTFFPFAAGLGDRRIESFGGDYSTWEGWLMFALAFSGIIGALLGAFGGFLSCAFCRALRRSERSRLNRNRTARPSTGSG